MIKTNVPRLRFSGFSGEWKEDKLLNFSKLRTGNRNVQDSLDNGKYVFFDRSNEIKLLNEFEFEGKVLVYPGEGAKFLPRKFEGKYSLHQRAYGLYDFKNIDYEFLFQELLTQNRHFLRYSVGTTAKSLRKDCFERLIIKFADFQEQQKIGEFFAKQDKLIELQTQKVDQLKKLKRGYLQKMFPQEGETVPRLRFSGFSGEWKEEKLGDVTIRFDNKRVPIKESNRVHGCVPYYGANGIQDYVEGMTHTGNNILIAEDGANDINNYPVFHTEGNIWVNNHAHVLKSQKNKSDSLFISYCLKMIPYSKYLTGNGRYKLNADVLMEIKVNIPCLSEQQKIGSFFAKIDKLIEEQSNKLDKLKQQKKAYLQKMFI